MNKPFPLQVLIDLAQARSDSVRRKLGQTNTNLQQAEERFTQLLNYRNEYHARYRQAVADGIGVEGLRNFQEFMDRLDTAIGQQRAHLAQWNARVVQTQRDFAAEQNNLKRFDTLKARHQAEQSLAAGRAEQREQDDWSSKSHTRRLVANGVEQ